jgi:hypothetical protein
MHGCISYLSTRLPTKEELLHCKWVTFTSEAEWQPYSDTFREAEVAMINHNNYPDPCHPSFDKQGNRLDGRVIKSINTIDAYSDLDPSLCTFYFTYQKQHISATSSKDNRSKFPHNVLARRWGTSLHTASETMKVTTQRGLRYLEGPLSRSSRTRQKQLDNKYLSTKMYTDTFFKDKMSAWGNTCAQLFVTAEGFVAGKPMKTKADAYVVLEHVCCKYGVPKLLMIDRAKEELLGDWGRITKQNLIPQNTTEPHSGWQNRCEDKIREIMKHFQRVMAANRCPEAFWDSHLNI